MFEAEGRETHIFLGLMAEQSETQMLGVVELRETIPMCCLRMCGGGSFRGFGAEGGKPTYFWV